MSRCANAQFATVVCRHPEYAYMEIGLFVDCQPNEICINTGAYPIYGQGGGKAYCVSTENFIDIATAQLTALGYDLPGSSPASKATSAEALIVPRAIDGPPRKARKLDLIAYGKHAIAGHASILRELHNGRAYCGNCSSVNLQPLPPRTRKLRALVDTRSPLATSSYLVITT